MANKIYNYVQSLEPGSKVELLELDTRRYPGGDILRFHAYRQEDSIWWQGEEFKPFPVELTGFEKKSSEQPTAPVFRVADPDGVITHLCHLYSDLVNCRLVRHVTLARFLDARNFPDGNPEADPNEHFTPDVLFIEQKIGQVAGSYVEFELQTLLGRGAVGNIPGRTVMANVCSWSHRGGYRGPNCGYQGTKYFDENNNPVASPDLDKCNYLISGCSVRNGDNPDGLPFGSYPVIGLTRLYA